MGQEGWHFVTDLCKDHKAWTGHHEPTTEDIRRLFEITGGNTTIVTCTRWAASLVNQLALRVLFESVIDHPMAVVPADYESNWENYDEHGDLLEQEPAPFQMPLRKGLFIRLTRNMDKRRDYVNGMGASVLEYNAKSSAIIVETVSKAVLSIYPITDDKAPSRETH